MARCSTKGSVQTAAAPNWISAKDENTRTLAREISLTVDGRAHGRVHEWENLSCPMVHIECFLERVPRSIRVDALTSEPVWVMRLTLPAATD